MNYKIMFVLVFVGTYLIAGTSSDYEMMRTDSILYVGLACFLVLAGLAGAFILGKVLNSPQIIAFVNVEWANMLVSILLTFFVLGAFIGINESLELTYGADMFTMSFNYIDSLVNNALQISMGQTKQSVLDQYKTTDYMFIGTPMTSTGGCGKSYRGFNMAYAQHREMVVDLLMMAAISLELQKYVLYGITLITTTFFLPVGLMLRILPKLKMAGNFLISLAFALGIIYPATYVLHSQMHAELYDDPSSLTSIGYNDEVFPNTAETGYILSKMALIFPQAYFLPNLTLLIVGACIAGMFQALNGIQV